MPKTTNKEKVLNALLNTNSITDAARECGLSEATVHRYLEDENFQKESREG